MCTVAKQITILLGRNFVVDSYGPVVSQHIAGYARRPKIYKADLPLIALILILLARIQVHAVEAKNRWIRIQRGYCLFNSFFIRAKTFPVVCGMCLGMSQDI